MILEDPTTPELVAKAEAASRAALVRAEALAALSAAQCIYPDLWAPSIENELRAVHVSDDGLFRVFAVDSRGEIRSGPRGPMTARDVVERVSAETPEHFGKNRKR